MPAWFRPFIHALQAIVAGSRDRTLADAPDLDYTMAAEILFLIETLEKAPPPPRPLAPPPKENRGPNRETPQAEQTERATKNHLQGHPKR